MKLDHGLLDNDAAHMQTETELMYSIRHQIMEESLQAVVVLNNCSNGTLDDRANKWPSPVMVVGVASSQRMSPRYRGR